MPELPEVETIRQTLHPLLMGTTITQAVGSSKLADLVPNQDSRTLLASLTGRRIVGTGRRGKFLLLFLDDHRIFLVHFGMTGVLVLNPAIGLPSSHTHLYLTLDDSRVLRYYDPRRFGRLAVLTPEAYAELDRRLGVEPLDPQLTAERLAARITRHRRALKATLLDQHVIAGIGNIYADEILFAARLHPCTPSERLGLAESERLLHAMRAVLTNAISRHGTTFRDYRDGLGKPGTNQYTLQVYGRSPGAPCYHCGSPLQQMIVAGRTTTYCPTCQPLPAS